MSGFADPFRTAAPLEVLAAANLLCHLGTAMGGVDGIHTDVTDIIRVQRASDAEVAEMARASAAENARWRAAGE